MAAGGFHYDESFREVRFIAIVALPVNDRVVQTFVMGLRIEFGFWRENGGKTRVVLVRKRPDDIPVANGVLRLAKPEGRPGGIIEVWLGETEPLARVYRIVFHLRVGDRDLVWLKAKLPRAREIN